VPARRPGRPSPTHGGENLAVENMQSRLRGVIMMTISNAEGRLVLATGNKSELAVGYCTLYGDTNGGLSVLGDVLKTEVYKISRHINNSAKREIIPFAIIDKKPSAELAPNQFDQDSLPPYDLMDAVLKRYFEDKLAPFPAFILGWKIPQRRTPEHNALALAGKIISEGESSRLYQKLVKGEESVLQLVSFTDERRGPSGFLIFAIPKPGNDLSKIRETIMNEIKDMATNGATAEEMQKLHNNLINDAVRSRQSSLSRAQAIAEFALYDNDPTIINSELDDLLKITPAQIKEAVNKYLNTENRVLLDIVPAGKGDKPTTNGN